MKEISTGDVMVIYCIGLGVGFVCGVLVRHFWTKR